MPFFSQDGLLVPIFASLLNDNAISLSPHGDSKTLLTEKNVHFLQRQALSLRQKEVDEHAADHKRSTEEQKGPVGDAGQHVRGRVDDDELREPLGACGED